MTFLLIYVGVSTALYAGLRKFGPWWKVAGGSLAWPLWPFILGGSKFRHARQRRVLP